MQKNVFHQNVQIILIAINRKSRCCANPLCFPLTVYSLFIPKITTEKHRMSFPETVDEILDVSEDEGRYDWLRVALASRIILQ